MRAPGNNRRKGPAGPDRPSEGSPEAAGEPLGAAGCPLLPAVMTAEVAPFVEMWLALGRLLRERADDAADRAIADAIDAATEA